MRAVLDLNLNGHVGVLLPIYLRDNPTYFSLALDSILTQTVSNFTVLLLIDGPISDDLELEILKINDSRVQILRFQENRGLAYVLNEGIEKAKSMGVEFIARMDADDISLPHRFEKQIEFFRLNPDIDILGTAIREIDEQSLESEKIIFYPQLPRECYERFKTTDPVCHPAVMFRTRFFRSIKGYPTTTRYHQDTNLWALAFEKSYKFANCSEPLLLFRRTDQLLSRRTKSSWNNFLNRVKINWRLSLGIKSYLMTFTILMVKLQPLAIKRFIYEKVR